MFLRFRPSSEGRHDGTHQDPSHPSATLTTCGRESIRNEAGLLRGRRGRWPATRDAVANSDTPPRCRTIRNRSVSVNRDAVGRERRALQRHWGATCYRAFREEKKGHRRLPTSASAAATRQNSKVLPGVHAGVRRVTPSSRRADPAPGFGAAFSPFASGILRPPFLLPVIRGCGWSWCSYGAVRCLPAPFALRSELRRGSTGEQPIGPGRWAAMAGPVRFRPAKLRFRRGRRRAWAPTRAE